ncbi:hypothetical protein, partial [Saccharothrix coeruleofusca]
MNDQKKSAEQQFAGAYRMPDGMARHEALERAARAADACDHLPLGVSCRIALLRSAYDLGRYDLMLAPFAWCGAAERRDPTAFDEWERHSFDWAHKWIVSGLVADHRFTLEQIRSVLDQLASRYQRHGFSLQPVHGARADLAEHIGDEEGYREHFARYLAADRGPMSDCEACVVEDQAGHLIRQGRHAEAVAHAERQLGQDSGCATQPQGILSTLAPAFVALGELDRAREAHVVAHRLVRDDEVSSYVDAQLVFCATTGNVARGVELLQRHLHRVHGSTSPAQAMRFAAGAALLLSRVDEPVEFLVPVDGRTTAFTAPRLRALLEERALGTAALFDQRNGTDAVSRWVRRTLETPDTAHVPLAVPVAAPAPVEAEPVVADPVELARGAVEAFDGDDMLTGMRLLRSLPAELDPLLPEVLAAQVAARRALVADEDDAARAEFTAAVERLAGAGEHDLAARYRARGALRWFDHSDEESAIAVVRACLAQARTPDTAVPVRLVLVKLLAHAGDLDGARAVLAEAAELAESEVPRLLPRVRCEQAEQLAVRQRLDEAHAAAVALLADRPPASVRFNALRLRLRLEVLRGDAEAALATADALVDDFSTVRGPWTGEAHQQRMAVIDQLGLAHEHLPELREAVAAAHEWGTPPEVVGACYVLSGGYLGAQRPVEAAEALEEALRVADGALPPGERTPVLFRLGQVCAQLGELEAAQRHLGTALDHVEPDDLVPRATVLDALAAVRGRQGQEAEAARCYREAALAWEAAEEPGEAAGSWVEAASASP